MISVIKRTSSVIFHTQLLIAVHDFAAGLQAAISLAGDTCIETKVFITFPRYAEMHLTRLCSAKP